jgi:hypothetical protein
MSQSLAPRPALEADDLAALLVVSEEFVREQVRLSTKVDSVPIWRFSGRWFNVGPYAQRRPLAVNR